MASRAEWFSGARPRTLPAALAPVVAGSAVAWFEKAFSLLLAALAMIVALALQVGVNYANDYSDGIRGTDDGRIGPMRLVGSGAASPRQVRAAAIVCFALAALAGLFVVVITGIWWLLAVGAAAIAAAWYYTGGARPYGYRGLGELFVFVFFGLVATGGTAFIQVGWVPASAWWASTAMGTLACAILVANNLRDIEADQAAGKLTLATRLGEGRTRGLYVGLLGLATLAVAGVGVATSWWALLGWLMLPILVRPVVEVLRGATGIALVQVLKHTGMAELVCSVGLLAGLMIGR